MSGISMSMYLAMTSVIPIITAVGVWMIATRLKELNRLLEDLVRATKGTRSL